MNIDNSLLPPVADEIVEQKFVALRESPILVFSMLIDCDEDSLNTMRQAIKYFDIQPPVHNVFEVVDGQKYIVWRLTDNTPAFLSKPQLEGVLAEVESQKALRTSKLYAKKRQIKDSGNKFDDVHSNWL